MKAPLRIWSGSDSIQLGRRLGIGGEGTVYLGEFATAIKLYTVPPSRERIAKLETLVALESETLRRISAWPTAVVRDAGGSVAGFIMPCVENRVPLTQLTSPAERKRVAPDRHWNFLVHVCRNIAVAMQTIHDAGVVIADVNDLNILVSLENGRVTFIDVDSFQVKHNGTIYPTGVGVPMYLAPELQGCSLEGLVRSIEHDRFALAVLIFQALMMGRHPFVGTGNIGTGELPDMIRNLPFAYGSNARLKGIKIPPAALPISVLSAELGELFATAFESQARPEARAWIAPLERFQSALKQCPKNAGHLFIPDCSPCPWCELEKLGVMMFYASATEIAASFSASDSYAKAYHTWLESIRLPKNELPINPETLSLTADVGPAITMLYSITLYTGWLILIGIVIFMFVAGWSFQAVIALFLGASYLLGNGVSQKREAIRVERTNLVNQTELEWKNAVQAWQNPPIAGIVKQKLEEAKQAVHLSHNRKHEWEKRLNALEGRKHQIQLDEHLDRFDIATAREHYRSLTRPVITTLASFGISTALDISRIDSIKIPGIGEVRATALREWRRTLERKFSFDPKKPLPSALVRAEEAKLAGEIVAAEQRLPSLKTTIDAGLRAWEAERSVRISLLQESAEKLARARANLAVV